MQDKNANQLSADLAVIFDGKTCIKCHYKRQSTDVAPEWACPSCGVAYVKAEAAAHEEQGRLDLQNRIERVEYVKANQKVDQTDVAKIKSEKKMANLIYFLFFASILGGITGLAAIVLAYAQRDSLGKKNWVQSHFAWQIRTFWFAMIWSSFGLLLVVISFITASAKGLQNRSLNDALISFFNPFMMIGLAIIVISTLWFWYRMIKGCVVLSRDETVGDFFDVSM